MMSDLRTGASLDLQIVGKRVLDELSSSLPQSDRSWTTRCVMWALTLRKVGGPTVGIENKELAEKVAESIQKHSERESVVLPSEVKKNLEELLKYRS